MTDEQPGATGDRVAGERPRVALVTNGNYFANLALGPLLHATRDRYDWSVTVTTGLRKQSGNRAGEALSLLRRWGSRYMAYKLATYALPALASRVDHRARDVADTCRDLELAPTVARNVNESPAREQIEAFRPDLLVSFSCPYRIKPVLLDLPRIGALNVHSSLLPAYAGVCTYVHVLANGERVTGITVHEMVEEFDAGRIVAQQEVSIRAGASVFELFSEQCRTSGILLGRAIADCLDAGDIVGWPQDLERRSYFGEPTVSDIRALRARGHRLMRRQDASGIFRPGG